VTAWRVRAAALPGGDAVDAGISGAGSWTSRPAPGAELLPGRFVLPGLVDAHCHLSVGQTGDGQPVALDAAAARANAARARSAGVTAIRDTGSPGSVTLGLLPTPDGAGLLACGRFLAPPGQYYPGLYAPVPAADLVGAALAEVAAGARWVKLIADFPVLRPGEAALDPAPTYPLADVRRLVQAVHAAGARVAAHATTRQVTGLIDAGIDSVEHGTALTEADLSALAARGGAWTPTLCATIGADLTRSDPDRRKRRHELRERLSSLLPDAARRGVTIMTGTDVVGTIPREVALLAGLGLPPQAALAAASTAARRFLGFAAGIQHGEPADLVSYDNDPRDDPAVLAHPAAVFAGGIRIA